jgi:hypothetical protein
VITYPCEAIGCDKVFHQIRARLEHEVKRHPGLSHLSIQQKKCATGNHYAPFLLDPEWHLYSEIPTTVYPPHRFPTRLHRDDPDIIHAIKCVGAWHREARNLEEPRSMHHKTTRSNLALTRSIDYILTHATKNMGVEPVEYSHSIHRERTESDLTPTYESDNSLTHDQESIFSCNDPSGTTITDVSGTFEPSNLQHTGNFRFEVSEDSGSCLEPDMEDLDDRVEREAMVTSHWTYLPDEDVTKPSPQISEAPAVQVQNLKSARLVIGASPDIPQTSRVKSEQVACVSGQVEPSVRIRLLAQPRGDNCEDFRGICTSDRQVLPPLGQYLIDSLNAKFDPGVRLRHWTKFFSRWEGILEVLESRRYGYAPILGY